MALITTDTYFDTLTVSALGEVFRVDNGATLTIRASNSGANLFPGGFDAVNGSVVFSTTAVGASAPIIFFLSNTSTTLGLSASQNGRIVARGQWYNITSSAAGTANQTYIVGNYPSNKTPATTVGTYWCFPFVRVETASASNQWRYFLNYGMSGIISQATTLIPRNLTTQAGATAGFLTGHVGSGTALGEFFAWTVSTSAIRFGDGITGSIPAGGARIQVPDIFITTTGVYVSATGSRLRLLTANTGIIDLDTVMFSDRVALNAAQPKSVRMHDTGIHHFNISECYDVSLSSVMVPPGRTAEVVNSTIANAAVNYMNDCKISAWVAGNGGAASFVAVDPFYINRSYFIQQSRQAAITQAVNFINCNNIYIYGGVVVGGSMTFTTCNGGTVTGVGFATHNTGTTASAGSNTQNSAIVLSQTFNMNFRDLYAAGAVSGIWSSGPSCPNVAFFNAGANSKNIKWSQRNVEIDGNYNSLGLLTIGAFTVDTYVSDMRARRINGAMVTDSNAVLGLYLANWAVSGWNALTPFGEDTRSLLTQAIKVSAKNFSASRTGFLMSQAAVYDSPFHHVVGGQGAAFGQTGVLQMIMTPPITRSYYSTISGNPRGYDNNGLFYMNTSGDIVSFTWDYKILGVTGFRNQTVLLSASPTFASSVVQQYAIRPATATDYYPFKTCYPTNFASENITASASPDLGFYLKFQFTTTATQTNNSVCGYGIAVDMTRGFRYPVGTVSLAIENVVSGSQIWVKLNSTNEVLTNETSTGGTTYLAVPYDFDGTSPTVTVRVRKSTTTPKYIPFETSGSYNENGGSVYVSQIEDTIAS